MCPTSMRVVAADASHVNYCFRAQALLRHRRTKKVVGSFATYDANPEAFSTIRQLCALYESPELECTEVAVTMHAVCPAPQDTIDVIFYGDEPVQPGDEPFRVDGSGYDSDDDD